MIDESLLPQPDDVRFYRDNGTGYRMALPADWSPESTAIWTAYWTGLRNRQDSLSTGDRN